MLEINVYPADEYSEKLQKLYPIKPANQVLPEWYKKQKISHRGSLEYSNIDASQVKNAKQCPAIQDLVSDGYVLSLWQDIYFVKEGGRIVWRTYADAPGEPTSIQSQSLYQLVGMDTNHVKNYGILKFVNPYFFTTPKGYGLHFFDPFYHFRKDVKVLPGKVETDIWHEVNFPFEFFKPFEDWEEGEVLFLKAGEPLVQMIVYDKNIEKTKLNLNKFDKDFIDKKEVDHILSSSVSQSFSTYKKLKEDMI